MDVDVKPIALNIKGTCPTGYVRYTETYAASVVGLNSLMEYHAPIEALGICAFSYAYLNKRISPSWDCPSGASSVHFDDTAVNVLNAMSWLENLHINARDNWSQPHSEIILTGIRGLLDDMEQNLIGPQKIGALVEAKNKLQTLEGFYEQCLKKIEEYRRTNFKIAFIEFNAMEILNYFVDLKLEDPVSMMNKLEHWRREIRKNQAILEHIKRYPDFSPTVFDETKTRAMLEGIAVAEVHNKL